MKVPKPPKFKHFTEAARLAAYATRQAKAALPKGDEYSVTAFRSEHDHRAFHWQIRQFGGIVIRTDNEVFATQIEAVNAGQIYLRKTHLAT